MICPICQSRKAKRNCPALGSKICSIDCGSEREVSLSCPLECSYLREGREREWRESGLDPKNIPFSEVSFDDEFLSAHGELLEAMARALVTSALSIPGANDRDVQQALEALAQTWKTLESGLYYESRAESAFGRDIAREIRSAIEQYQNEQSGLNSTPDSDILRMLVFFYRLSLDRANPKPRGRAFLHLLAEQFAEQQETSAEVSPIILPGA